MKILLFGGTTEGREIAASGLPVIYSVTTDYGAELADFPNVEPLIGRMDVSKMVDLVNSRAIAGVIDATHPYAAEATSNIRAASTESGIPYIRVMREISQMKGVTSVLSYEEAVDFLLDYMPGVKGNALLTVGGRDLKKFAALPEPMKKRLYARVLPSAEVIASCEKLGFGADHIIAMKGPFSKAMNKAMLEMTDSCLLVTKDGGVAGGIKEKLSAAHDLRVHTLVIGRLKEMGVNVTEAIEWGFGRLGLPRPSRFPLFPLFTNIAKRHAIVIGGGKVAARRVKALLACGALVTVVSPDFDPLFDEPEFDKVHRRRRPYQKGDLKGAVLGVATLAVIATDDREVNREAGAEARESGIPVSVADAAEECSFFFPAFVDWEGVTAAVSTGGRSPSMCRRLADRLRAVWPGWVKQETKN